MDPSTWAYLDSPSPGLQSCLKSPHSADSRSTKQVRFVASGDAISDAMLVTALKNVTLGVLETTQALASRAHEAATNVTELAKSSQASRQD